jgi:hypothetical protein
VVRAGAGAPLDVHGVAGGDQALDGVRGERDAAFVVRELFRDGDAHGASQCKEVAMCLV